MKGLIWANDVTPSSVAQWHCMAREDLQVLWWATLFSTWPAGRPFPILALRWICCLRKQQIIWQHIVLNYTMWYSKTSLIRTLILRTKRSIQITRRFELLNGPQESAENCLCHREFILWKPGQWTSAFKMKTTWKGQFFPVITKCFTAYKPSMKQWLDRVLKDACATCLPNKSHPMLGVEKGHTSPCEWYWLALLSTKGTAHTLTGMRGEHN